MENDKDSYLIHICMVTDLIDFPPRRLSLLHTLFTNEYCGCLGHFLPHLSYNYIG